MEYDRVRICIACARTRKIARRDAGVAQDVADFGRVEREYLLSTTIASA